MEDLQIKGMGGNMNGEEIANAVNKIIKSLNKKDFKDEAINWGDLSVHEVVRRIELWPNEDFEVIEVVIEEADSSSYRFCAEIIKRFKEKYGFEIYVFTEW